MHLKVLLFLLIVSSLFGYLEWGGGNSSFLFEAEYLVISKIFTEPQSALHPVIILPLIGQILLIIALISKSTNKFITYTGIIFLSLLIGFMFLIGLMSLNLKIIISTLPFMIISTFTIYKMKIEKLN